MIHKIYEEKQIDTKWKKGRETPQRERMKEGKNILKKEKEKKSNKG